MQKREREGGTKSRSFFTIGSSFEWRGFPVEQLDITTTACSLSLLSFFLFFSPNESRGKGEMEGASEGGGIFSDLRRGDRNQRSADPCEFSRFFESGILKKVCVCPQRGVRKERERVLFSRSFLPYFCSADVFEKVKRTCRSYSVKNLPRWCVSQRRE